MAYLLRFGFDMGGATEVKIGYAELICNDFRLFFKILFNCFSVFIFFPEIVWRGSDN